MSKAGEVRSMFDALAPKYDRMNRIMTFGRDQSWRRFVVDRAELSSGMTVLDLAGGTGDIGFEIKRRFSDTDVVVGDFSLGMLQRGRERPQGGGVRWVACDAMRLPFADATFDAVTFGYLLRNVDDIDVALREVRRVLKPGGRVVCLDTMPPPSGFMRPFLRAYLSYGLPLLGRLIAGNTGAYAYLCSSTLGFENPERLKQYFADAGFVRTVYRTFMFQTVAVHWAAAPGA